LWLAALVHRLSGIGLAIFLPFHFYVLGMALNDAEHLDGLLKWTDHPVLKLAEFGLVLFLALHLFGGLRLLALEFLPWKPAQKTYAAVAAALSVLFALLFLLRSV
jgi:fumarate reductase subunit D